MGYLFVLPGTTLQDEESGRWPQGGNYYEEKSSICICVS